MTSRFLKLEGVIVIDSDDEPDVTVGEQEECTENLNAHSPSMLSDAVSYCPVITRESKTINWTPTARTCKLEPEECSSAQYLQRTQAAHISSGSIDVTKTRISEERMEGKFDQVYNCNQGSQLGEVEMNGSVTGGISPLKKLRKRKLLKSHDGNHSSLAKGYIKPSPGSLNNGQVNGTKLSFCKKPEAADRSTSIGRRISGKIVNLPQTVIPHSSYVNVIKSTRELPSTLPDNKRDYECEQIQDDFSKIKAFASSTPKRPQDNRPASQFHSLVSSTSAIEEQNTSTAVKMEPNNNSPSPQFHSVVDGFILNKGQKTLTTVKEEPNDNRSVLQFPSSSANLTSTAVKKEPSHQYITDTTVLTTVKEEPNDNRPVLQFPSSSANLTSTAVKKEPSQYITDTTVKRKRKLLSSDLDTETTDSNTHQPDFLDSNIVFSHTKKNSRAQFCFITQLQAQGYALPHALILELVQEMMMANSLSKRNTIYSILWSDSERFPHATNKDILDNLFTTIIDSLMTTKYYQTENANMALHYLLNIFCVDWKNSTMELHSYISTFLLSKIRQLLYELRKFYEKPSHLFCPHVASTLQQLVCLPLAVMHEPQKLEFSQSLFTKVFLGLTRDKQKVFLNNLSSPYLVTQLVTTLLITEYVPLESRELLWPSNYNFINSTWISTLLTVVSPYLPDGSEDLTHMLWLITQLLDKFVQYQRGGVVLYTPVCIINPLLTIEPDLLQNCSGVMDDFLDRLTADEILYNTCLFKPEVCHYMKLIMALVEDKTISTLSYGDMCTYIV